MKQRGRSSAAELAVTPIHKDLRPDPPADLTDEQQKEWRLIVGRLPAEWFLRESHGILAAYCRHSSRARRLARELDELEDLDDLIRFDKLSKAAERETRAMLACARSLRITNQSRYDAAKAARGAAAAPSGARPWED
jgi:phage terminase small subunit